MMNDSLTGGSFSTVRTFSELILTHDELLSIGRTLLKRNKRNGHKNKNNSTKFSRYMQMTAKALHSKKWSKGSGEVNMQKLIKNFVERFYQLTEDEKCHITEKARRDFLAALRSEEVRNSIGADHLAVLRKVSSELAV